MIEHVAADCDVTSPALVKKVVRVTADRLHRRIVMSWRAIRSNVLSHIPMLITHKRKELAVTS